MNKVLKSRIRELLHDARSRGLPLSVSLVVSANRALVSQCSDDDQLVIAMLTCVTNPGEYDDDDDFGDEEFDGDEE